jgi:hypothetical protein
MNENKAKYYLDLVEGAPTMEMAAIYSKQAEVHATLAVVDELRQLRDAVREVYSLVYADAISDQQNQPNEEN